MKVDFEKCSFEDCSLKIKFGECSLKMEFEVRSLNIGFEEKQAFFELVEVLKSEIFILEVNFGASVDVGRNFFMVHFRPWDPTNLRFGKKAKQFMIYETR